MVFCGISTTRFALLVAIINLPMVQNSLLASSWWMEVTLVDVWSLVISYAHFNLLGGCCLKKCVFSRKGDSLPFSASICFVLTFLFIESYSVLNAQKDVSCLCQFPFWWW